ncbi:hypothetical protein SAMD00019534_034570, partial [Acytostelium subglobosum LB1]|uniref:hypothetical protein n=1 Tax=Acytostelium subglobosum LB1 TaxID=1410327 RepID=UPI000644BFC1
MDHITSFDNTAHQLFYKRYINRDIRLGIDEFDNYISNNPIPQPQQHHQQQQHQQHQQQQQLQQTIFSKGGFIEVFGPSSCGKTELLYHVVAQSVMPKAWSQYQVNGNEIGVIYFDNDFKFDIFRFKQVIKLKLFNIIDRQQQQQLSNDEFETFFTQCTSRLYLLRCRDSLQFLLTLKSLPNMIKTVGKDVRAGSPQREIQMIVVDSISAFYWLDKKGESLSSRSGQLVGIDVLSSLVYQFNVVVIGVKQAIFNYAAPKSTISSHDNQQHTTTSLSKSFPRTDFISPLWGQLVKYRINIPNKFTVESNDPQALFSAPHMSILRSGS